MGQNSKEGLAGMSLSVSPTFITGLEGHLSSFFSSGSLPLSFFNHKGDRRYREACTCRFQPALTLTTAHAGLWAPSALLCLVRGWMMALTRAGKPPFLRGAAFYTTPVKEIHHLFPSFTEPLVTGWPHASYIMADGAHVLGLSHDYGPTVYTSSLAHHFTRRPSLQTGLNMHVRVKRNQSLLTIDSQFVSLGIYLTCLESVAAGGPDIPAYLKTFYFLKENTRNMIHVRVLETDSL